MRNSSRHIFSFSRGLKNRAFAAIPEDPGIREFKLTRTLRSSGIGGAQLYNPGPLNQDRIMYGAAHA